MKKQFARILAAALCLALLAGCGATTSNTTAAPTQGTTTSPATQAPAATDPTTAPTEAPAEPATIPATTEPVSKAPVARRVTEYLYTLYGKMAAPTPEDYTMPGSMTIDGEEISIGWEVEMDAAFEGAVELVRGDDNLVTIDVDEETPEEVAYILTAIVNHDGVEDKVSFNHIVPAAASDLSVAETVARLYTLEPGQSMPGTHVMRGTIVAIPTEYSADYDNVTVDLLVTDEEHIVQCFRLKGGKELAVGDTITVMGALKRYNDTFEFDAGAIYSKELSVEEMKQRITLEKLFALEAGDSLKGSYVLRGTITEIPTPYSDDYDNVTVNLQIIEDDDRAVQCYRLKGGKELAVGDVITVTGSLKRYNDTFEFDAGATYSKEQSLEDAKALLVLDQLYALEPDQSLKGLFTLTGTVTEIVSAYSEEYGNITVNIQVAGDEDRPVQCYRLTGGKELAVGDVITVTGNLKRYKDTFEFDANCSYVKVEE